MIILPNIRRSLFYWVGLEGKNYLWWKYSTSQLVPIVYFSVGCPLYPLWYNFMRIVRIASEAIFKRKLRNPSS
jgi:hypothetical protein